MLESLSKEYKRMFKDIPPKEGKKLKETTNTKTDWNVFTDTEKMNAENTILAVGLLYDMCKVKLVTKAEGSEDKAKINYPDIKSVMNKSEAVEGSTGSSEYFDIH